jgi:nucleoid-associated protein YgaU
MECPICDKAGLPENAMICPQCDSDLSGFILIQKVATQKQLSEKQRLELKQELQKNKIQKRNVLLLSSAFILLLFCTSLWLWSDEKGTSPLSPYEQFKTDSLVNLIEEKEALIYQTKEENEALKSQKGQLKYVVKEGDYLIKISRFFYGDEEHYLDIIQENNLQDNAALLVGDTLILNLQN